LTVVVDASVVVAALVDSGDDGSWAEAVLASDDLAAPHLMPVEAANVLRRSVAADRLSTDAAALAHADLLELPVVLFPYGPFGARVWELRTNLTAYDAWYVALAEAIDAQLATLDRQISRAPGVRCPIRTPGSAEG
jgi:predicted nucleic acid-binding protein